MIQLTKSYTTDDGTLFSSIEEAQVHAIISLFMDACTNRIETTNTWFDHAARTILKNNKVVVDILTTTPSSKTRARAVNGGRKKRRVLITSAVPPVADEELKS